ncbi:hypothetical protein Tco_0046859 [Tanacetum coccineum]
MIQVKEMMQDKDLKNSKSKDKGSRSRSQSMNEQSRYKQEQDKDKSSTSKQVNFNIGDIKVNLNIRGDFRGITIHDVPDVLALFFFNFAKKEDSSSSAVQACDSDGTQCPLQDALF